MDFLCIVGFWSQSWRWNLVSFSSRKSEVCFSSGWWLRWVFHHFCQIRFWPQLSWNRCAGDHTDLGVHASLNLVFLRHNFWLRTHIRHASGTTKYLEVPPSTSNTTFGFVLMSNTFQVFDQQSMNEVKLFTFLLCLTTWRLEDDNYDEPHINNHIEKAESQN